MKKRLVSGVLAMVMMISMMAISAFAIESEAVKGQETHTVTVDAELVPLATTTKGSLNIGLALDAGASGWSTVYELKFSSGIPTDAVVQNVQIVPGTATYNSAATQLQGLVVVTQFKVTAPNGKSTTMAFDKTMQTTELNGAPVRGTWTFQMYGTNITAPVGDWTDSLRFGSIHYKSCSVTITY